MAAAESDTDHPNSPPSGWREDGEGGDWSVKGTAGARGSIAEQAVDEQGTEFSEALTRPDARGDRAARDQAVGASSGGGREVGKGRANGSVRVRGGQ